jgi:hypothetical protein
MKAYYLKRVASHNRVQSDGTAWCDSIAPRQLCARAIHISLSCTTIAVALPRHTVEVIPCLMISRLAASACWMVSTGIEDGGLVATTESAVFMLKHRERFTRKGDPMNGTARSSATCRACVVVNGRTQTCVKEM